MVRLSMEQQVDGLIVTPALGSSERFISNLASSGIPVVISIRPVEDQVCAATHGRNRTTFEVAEGSLELISRRTESEDVADIGGFEGLGPRAARVEGVARGLAQAPRRGRVVADIPETSHRPVSAMRRRAGCWRPNSLPDGVVCHNDTVAFGLDPALRALAPERVERIHVIGFDNNVDEAALWEPPLTTLAVNGREVGRPHRERSCTQDPRQTRCARTRPSHPWNSSYGRSCGHQ